MDYLLSSSFQACNFLVHFAFKIPVRAFRSDVKNVLKVVVVRPKSCFARGKEIPILGRVVAHLLR